MVHVCMQVVAYVCTFNIYFLLNLVSLVQMSVCMCMCVHPTHQAIKNHSRSEAQIIKQTNPNAFQFACMALVIDITHGCGLSNKACH